MPKKASKGEMYSLAAKNLGHLKDLSLEQKVGDRRYYCGVDLSLSSTGIAIFSLSDQETTLAVIDTSKLKTTPRKLQALNAGIMSMLPSGSKAVVFYERVTAMSHFTGLRAVSQAEGVLLSQFADSDVSFISISSTALKKFFLGKGKHSNADKASLRQSMGLKKSQDPLKHLVVNAINQRKINGVIDDIEDHNIADALTAYLFGTDILKLASYCHDVLGGDPVSLEAHIKANYASHEYEALWAFLTSKETIKEMGLK